MKKIFFVVLWVVLSIASLSFAGSPGLPIQPAQDQSHVTISGGTIAGTTYPGLTASLPVFTDGSKAFVSESLASLKTFLGLGTSAYLDIAHSSGTLTAGTTTTITNASAKTTSGIFLQSTNAGFIALAPYVSTKNNGSFVITQGIAAGTETFDYLIVN